MLKSFLQAEQQAAQLLATSSSPQPNPLPPVTCRDVFVTLQVREMKGDKGRHEGDEGR